MNGPACFEFLDPGALPDGDRLHLIEMSRAHPAKNWLPWRLLAATSLMVFMLAIRTALAQPVSFGVKGGVPLTDAVEGDFGGASEARRYTVGLMIELRLPASFAFEADGLYRRTGYRASQSDSGLTTLPTSRDDNA